jgi:hypothetical protein
LLRRHALGDDWGLLPVLDIIMLGVAETVDYELRKLFEAVRAARQYVRIDPELGDASPDVDDTSPENLRCLTEAGVKAARENDAMLNAVVKFVMTT